MIDQNTGKCLALLGECALLGNPVFSKICQKSCSSLKGSRTLATGTCRKLCSVNFWSLLLCSQSRGKSSVWWPRTTGVFWRCPWRLPKTRKQLPHEVGRGSSYFVPMQLLLVLDFQIGTGLRPLCTPLALCQLVCVALLLPANSW